MLITMSIWDIPGLVILGFVILIWIIIGCFWLSDKIHGKMKTRRTMTRRKR